MKRDHLRKLRSMSRHELRARSTALVTDWYDTALYGLGLSSRDEKLPDAGDVAFRGPWIDAHDHSAIAADLREHDADYVNDVISAADAVCRHEFTLLGQTVRYGESIAWQADPVSGKPWPSVFHTRVRIFSGNTGNGDVKFVWELNRHQFLPILGKAYVLTGDERYASAGLALIDDWIAANSYQIGINWASALEVAVRALSWCWALALFEGASALDSARRRRIVRALAQHGRYIERHLSLYFSPYNHLIGEATALYALGALLPWLPRSAAWADRGWAILDEQMPRQFHPDGGSVEQTTGYHHFTLGFYLQAALIRRHLGGEIGSRVWSGLERAFEFSMHMMRPDGSTPMIGDADEGKALQLAQPDNWDFRVFLGIGAVLFGRGDFKVTGGAFPPDAAWLLGAGGRSRYDAIGEEAPWEASQALPESGYYVMRSAWEPDAHYLMFDCGDLAAGVSPQEMPSAAHGHADALSIEVAAYGEPLIVDPGFWTYNGDIEWHRYFRETEAHNTVVVDRRSQAEFRGRLKWSHAPRVESHEWLPLGLMDYAEGSHYGYQRLGSPVVHRRAVIFLAHDYWVVRDELIGEGVHQLDRHFHFATADVTRLDDRRTVCTERSNGPNLAVVSVEQAGISVDVTRGRDGDAAGWLAVGYEQKVRGAVASYGTISPLPCALHALLVPFRGRASAVQVRLALMESDARSPIDRSFVVSRPGRRDVWAFSNGRHSRFHDGWTTDARTTCVSLNDDGDVIGCAFVSGSRVEINGEPLLALDRRVRGAAITIVDGRPVIKLSQPARVQACLLAPALVVFPDNALRTVS